MPDGVVFCRINITVGNGQRGIAALEGIEKGAFVEIAHIEIFRRVRIVQAVAVNGERDHRFAFGQSAGKRGIVCLAQDFSALRIVQNAVVLRDGGLGRDSAHHRFGRGGIEVVQGGFGDLRFRRGHVGKIDDVGKNGEGAAYERGLALCQRRGIERIEIGGGV